ncbi:MFS transporter [Luteimicrobium sp. DT211]
MSTAGLAEPRTFVPGAWIAAFATAWFGVWMAQLTPIQLLLPQQVDTILDPVDWVASVRGFGIVSAIAGVCALVAYPLTGALSDRTSSRFGRRRPWIAVGAVLFAVALVVLSVQHTIVGVAVWWSVTLVGFCVLTAALTATISDRVPVDQRGTVSGWMSAPQAAGILLGVGLVTVLGLAQVAGYVLVAVVLLVCVVPFLLRLDDPAVPREELQPFSLRAVVAGFWISPRQHPDFAWTLTSRILVMTGNGFGTVLLLYFLEYGPMHQSEDDAETGLLFLTLVYMVFVIVAALVLGRLSDRLGRRKVMVVVCAALQGAAGLLLAFVPVYPVALVAAALLGFGFGAFLSVDQALATQVLPSAADRGKDLGIMNVAYAVPQALAPLIGGWLVAQTHSFTPLFLAAGVLAIGGAFAVAPVRSVR